MKLKKFNESLRENTEKDLFIKSLNSLFYAWGGDTPPEVVWGCNELLDWYDIEFGTVTERFTEDDYNNYNFEQVIKSII